MSYTICRIGLEGTNQTKANEANEVQTTKQTNTPSTTQCKSLHSLPLWHRDAKKAERTPTHTGWLRQRSRPTAPRAPRQTQRRG